MAHVTPVGDELHDLLFSAMHQLREEIVATASTLGLTPPEVFALGQLDQPISQRELADCMGYDASNITAIVDRLEAHGLAERHVDPADRRVRRLVLTDAGRQATAELRTRLVERSPFATRLSPAERAELIELLRKVQGDAAMRPLLGRSLTGRAG